MNLNCVRDACEVRSSSPAVVSSSDPECLSLLGYGALAILSLFHVIFSLRIDTICILSFQDDTVSRRAFKHLHIYSLAELNMESALRALVKHVSNMFKTDCSGL